MRIATSFIVAAGIYRLNVPTHILYWQHRLASNRRGNEIFIYFLLVEPRLASRGLSPFFLCELDKNEAKTSHPIKDGQQIDRDIFCQSGHYCDKKCFFLKNTTRIVIFCLYLTIFVSSWGWVPFARCTLFIC